MAELAMLSGLCQAKAGGGEPPGPGIGSNDIRGREGGFFMAGGMCVAATSSGDGPVAGCSLVIS